jgi:glyoxylase-like metal-dependent hydrolase (beta-lactamase superfamily II)
LIVDAPREAWTAALDVADSHNAPALMAVATHGHWDHITDMSRISDRGIAIGGHRADRELFADPHGQGLTLPFAVEPVAIDRFLEDGARLSIDSVEIQVLHTPGHTPGSISLYVPRADALFTGDTLLKGGAGHTAEPGASLPALATSVRRLAAFPEATAVYAGHGAPTTIGDEAWLAALSDPEAPLVQWRPSNARRSKLPENETTATPESP